MDSDEGVSQVLSGLSILSQTCEVLRKIHMYYIPTYVVSTYVGKIMSCSWVRVKDGARGPSMGIDG